MGDARRDAEQLLGRRISPEEWETDPGLRLLAALAYLERDGFGVAPLLTAA